jgi:hypothetical protein
LFGDIRAFGRKPGSLSPVIWEGHRLGPSRLLGGAKPWGRAGLVIAAQVALLMLGAFLSRDLVVRESFDVALYNSVAVRVLAGEVPYKDFRLEYPPGAMLPFLLPRLALPDLPLTLSSYALAFAGLMTACSAAVTGAVARLQQRLEGDSAALRSALVTAVVSFLSAPVLLWRFDAFPVALTAFALMAALSRQPWLAGALVGLAASVKLYPLVLAPVLLLWWLARGQPKGAAAFACAAASGFLLPLLPLLAVAKGDTFVFLGYHSARGLQVESLPAGLLEIAHLLGATRLDLVFNYGALHLQGGLAAAIKPWVAPAFLLSYGLLLAGAWSAFRGIRQAKESLASRTLVEASAAAVLLFIVVNKVFSPQYLVWLLPFIPLLRGRLAALLALAAALTTVIYPILYAELLNFQPGAVILLNLRNALVATALIAIPLGWLGKRTTATR